MTPFIETLNHWGEQFLNLAWPMLWQSSLLIAIIFLLDLAFRRKIRAAIRYALWLMVLVKLLLPPSLALPTSLAWWLPPPPQSPAKPQTTAFVVYYGEQTAPALPPQFQPAPAPIQPEISSAAWTLAASGVVNAGLLAWLLVRWWQINQKVRRAKTSEKLIPILDEARRLTRLRPGIQLKLTGDSMSPAVCGLFRPVILLPQSLVERLSAGQLRAVLLHEAIHLRRGDVWVNCAQALLQIVYWWHPLLWLANARIRRVREEAVDDAVMLALRDDAEIYAPTLLEVAKLAFNRPLASLGLVGILESRSALRQRIERLMNFNAPRIAGVTVVSILGILVFSAVALPMGEAPEKTNAPNASASNSTIDTNAPKNVFNAGTGAMTVRGLLLDTNFQVVLHALEQRTGVETLAEPEPVTTAGQGANQINRIVVPDKINIPTITTNAAESGKLVQDGKLLYEMGKFDDAETKLKAALVLNPDNQAAHYYMNLIQESKTGRHTQDVHTSPGREMILRKLNSIRHESISWSNGLPLSEVIRYLAEQSKLRDPDKKGINFMFNPNVKTFAAAGAPNLISPATGLFEKPAAGAAPENVDPNTINVKLVMNDVSLHDVLDAVMLVADRPIKYSVEDFAVVLSPKPPPSSQLETRVFRVDTNTFVEGLQNISVPVGELPLPKLQTNSVPAMAERFYKIVGVDLTAPGRSVAYNDKLGLLFVRATASEMDTVERAIVSLTHFNPQIHIKARFIEVPKDGFVMPTTLSNKVAGQMTGILTDPEFRTVLYAMEHRQGVETLAEPECVTTSGRQTQMRATDIMTVLTNINPLALKPPGVASNELFLTEQVECGPVFDVVSYVLSDGYTLNLTATASLTEFLGYDKPTNSITAYIDGQKQTVPVPLPRFRIRKISTRVNLFDNQTLILAKPDEQFTGPVGKSDEDKNELLVFVTGTIVDPAGNRVHSDDKLPFNPSAVPPQPQLSTPSP